MKNAISHLLLLFVFFISININGQAPVNAWVKNAGSSFGQDIGSNIVTDTSGNSYVTGYFSGTAQFGSFNLTSNGSEDIFIAKYSPTGNCLWAKKAGGFFIDEGIDITIDNLGNIYITGYYTSTATFGNISKSCSGSTDVFIAKYDSNGNCIWVETINGTANEWSYTIKYDKVNNCLYLGGVYALSITFGTGGTLGLISTGAYEGFLAKINTTGNFIWAKNLGGASGDQWVSSLDVDNLGNIYVYGRFENKINFGTISLTAPIADTKNLFLVKYDSNGNDNWAKQIKRSALDSVIGPYYATEIAIDILGNVFLTGYSYSSLRIDNTDVLQQNSNQGIFIIKLNVNGNIGWGKMAGGTGYYWGNSIAVDNLGNAYVTGLSNGLMNFSPYILQSGNTLFIAKCDNTGNWSWLQYGTCGNNINGCEIKGKSIHVDRFLNIFVTGSLLGNGIFNSNAATSNSLLLEDVFIAKYGNNFTGIENLVATSNISVFPNPSTGQFIFSNIEKESVIEIYDITGRLIFTTTAQNTSETIDLSLKQKGVYFYKIISDKSATGGDIKQGKIIIQ